MDWRLGILFLSSPTGLILTIVKALFTALTAFSQSAQRPTVFQHLTTKGLHISLGSTAEWIRTVASPSAKGGGGHGVPMPSGHCVCPRLAVVWPQVTTKLFWKALWRNELMQSVHVRPNENNLYKKWRKACEERQWNGRARMMTTYTTHTCMHICTYTHTPMPYSSSSWKVMRRLYVAYNEWWRLLFHQWWQLRVCNWYLTGYPRQSCLNHNYYVYGIHGSRLPVWKRGKMHRRFDRDVRPNETVCTRSGGMRLLQGEDTSSPWRRPVHHGWNVSVFSHVSRLVTENCVSHTLRPAEEPHFIHINASATGVAPRSSYGNIRLLVSQQLYVHRVLVWNIRKKKPLIVGHYTRRKVRNLRNVSLVVQLCSCLRIRTSNLYSSLTQVMGRMWDGRH